MSMQTTFLNFFLPKDRRERLHTEKSKKSSRLEERTLRLKQEFNKYDTERAGYLDTYQLKRYLFDAFKLELPDAFVKQLIQDKTMSKDTNHLYFEDFSGFKKLIETNVNDFRNKQLPLFSIEEYVDSDFLQYKTSLIPNEMYSLPSYSYFQKTKVNTSLVPQNYYSSPHFDEICVDVQQRNDHLITGLSPIPFEVDDMHIFEYFNPTLTLTDVVTTYSAPQFHILKHMILINLEDIIFECGFFEPLVISVAIYNNKTVEKQIETIYFFRPLSGLKQQPFMVELEKIDKNEYWLFITIYRRDDGNDSVAQIYRDGLEPTESKKSKKQIDLIDKVKKKMETDINMISLQQVVVGCVRIQPIKDKIVNSNIPFLSVSFKLLNQPDVLKPLESYQVFDATKAHNLYVETPRLTKGHQRMKSSRIRSIIKMQDDAPTTVNSTVKENIKPSLLKVQNLAVSKIMRNTRFLNNTLYFTPLQLILSRERKTTITMEISLCHSLDEEPYEALLLPNYTVRPEKKLTFIIRSNDKIVSLMKEIRVELPTPPPLDIFFLIKMTDDTQSFCFIKLFNENGDPLDSNVEHNFPVYKGSGEKFMHDAFNGKGKSKRVLRARFTSTATFYPRYHVLHSLLNEKSIDEFEKKLRYITTLDATVIAPYLFMLLDKMIEIIEQVSLFKIVPILKKFFSDEEIRPVILLDYIKNDFSPSTLNIDIGKLPYRILKSICEGFEHFEEEEFSKFKLTFFFFQLFVRSYTAVGDKLESRLEIEKLLSKLFGLISFRMDIHIAKKDMRGIFEINLNVAELMRDLLCIANRDFVCGVIHHYYETLALRNSSKLDNQKDYEISTIYEILRLDFLSILRDYPMLVEVSCPTIHYTEIGSIYDISYQAHWLPTFIIRQCMYLVLNHSDPIKVMGALCLFEMIQRYDCGVAYQEHRKVAAEMFFPLVLFFIDEFEQIKEWTYQVFSNSKSNFIPQQQTAIRALFICFFFVLNEISNDLRQFFVKNLAPTSISKLLQVLVLGQQVFKTLDHHVQGTRGLYDFFRSLLTIQSLSSTKTDPLTIRTLYSPNSPFAMIKNRRVTIATKEDEQEKKHKKRHHTTKDTIAPSSFVGLSLKPVSQLLQGNQSKDDAQKDVLKRRRKLSLFDRKASKETKKTIQSQDIDPLNPTDIVKASDDSIKYRIDKKPRPKHFSVVGDSPMLSAQRQNSLGSIDKPPQFSQPSQLSQPPQPLPISTSESLPSINRSPKLVVTSPLDSSPLPSPTLNSESNKQTPELATTSQESVPQIPNTESKDTAPLKETITDLNIVNTGNEPTARPSPKRRIRRKSSTPHGYYSHKPNSPDLQKNTVFQKDFGNANILETIPNGTTKSLEFTSSDAPGNVQLKTSLNELNHASSQSRINEKPHGLHQSTEIQSFDQNFTPIPNSLPVFTSVAPSKPRSRMPGVPRVPSDEACPKPPQQTDIDTSPSKPRGRMPGVPRVPSDEACPKPPQQTDIDISPSKPRGRRPGVPRVPSDEACPKPPQQTDINVSPSKPRSRMPGVPRVPSDEACPKPKSVLGVTVDSSKQNNPRDDKLPITLTRSATLNNIQAIPITDSIQQKKTQLNTNILINPIETTIDINEQINEEIKMENSELVSLNESKDNVQKTTKKLDVPKLEIKKVETLQGSGTSTDYTSYIKTGVPLSGRMRTPTAISFRPSLNKSVIHSPKDIMSPPKKVGTNNLQTQRFLFGMKFETPRTRQRRQTESDKPPRGYEHSYVSVTAGINNEKVLNVYLYCMITSIIGDITTLCFSRHEHEEIKMYVGEILSEFSLSLNQYASISDVAFFIN
ncbi:DOCKER domain-containing protein [Entamoeba marina]